MEDLIKSVAKAVEVHVPMNVARARVNAGCFTGCHAGALPMHSAEEIADFLLYTPGVWGVGIRQPNGSNKIVAWFRGGVRL